MGNFDYHRHRANHPTLPYSQEMDENRCYYTYIAASRTRVLYVGVTGSIERRMTQHKNSTSESFTASYRCNRLVWFERYMSPTTAIAREKQLKGWRRERKLALIERENPSWIDQRKLGQTTPDNE